MVVGAFFHIEGRKEWDTEATSCLVISVSLKEIYLFRLGMCVAEERQNELRSAQAQTRLFLWAKTNPIVDIRGCDNL